jgi:hypothetical protein
MWTLLALLWAAAASSRPLAQAAVVPNATVPRIDFAALGLVALAGNFRGLQLYDANYQASLEALSPAQDAQTLWSRAQDGRLLPLGSTNSGGSISAICQADSGLIYVGGTFSSLATVTTANMASYDPSSDTFAALGSGLDGPVLSLYCSDDQIVAGGTFSAPVGATQAYGGSVAYWSPSSSSWSPPSFGGVRGAVRAITGAEDDRSVFYGGNFSLSIANGSTTSSMTSTTPTVALV